MILGFQNASNYSQNTFLDIIHDFQGIGFGVQLVYYDDLLKISLIDIVNKKLPE